MGKRLYSVMEYPATDLVVSWTFNGALLVASAYKSGTGLSNTLRPTLLCGLFLGSIGFANYKLKQAKFVDNYDLAYFTAVATYFYPTTGILSIPISAASIGTIRLAINTGYIEQLAILSLSVGAASMTYQWLKPCLIERYLKLALIGMSGVVILAIGQPMLTHLLPIDEVHKSYGMLKNYTNSELFDSKLSDLLVTTSNFMIPLAFLGIEYLKASQHKENMLIGIPHKYSAKEFTTTAIIFLVYHSFTYICLRITGEALNRHAFEKFNNYVQIDFLNNTRFQTGNNFLIIARSNISTVYAGSISNVVSKNYELIKDKLFSIPKLTLLPHIIQHHPIEIFTTVGIMLFIDFVKNKMMSVIIAGIEHANTELKILSVKYEAMEKHDNANSKLANAHKPLLKILYLHLMEEMHFQTMTIGILSTLKEYIEWLYWQDTLPTVIQCAIARLLASRIITPEEVFVYNRAIQDAITLIWSRSRSQAELASIKKDIDRLAELKGNLTKAELTRPLALGDNQYPVIQIIGLEFQRVENGVIKATILVPNLKLEAGKIYALIGPNGSGKSSLFEVIAGTADPYSFNITNPGQIFSPFPYTSVVTITQKIYMPLYVKPIDWIMGIDTSTLSPVEKGCAATKIATLFKELKFYTSEVDILADLEQEKHHWASDLSGGQRIKVELIKNIFFKDKCPEVLLLDETFGPLDSTSRQSVQSKIQEFCGDSIIVAIHHTDPGDCVGSMGFFDEVIQFNKTGNISVVSSAGALCPEVTPF